jgi:hypothetical protein
LIVLARSVKVLDQPLEAGPIERQKECLDIGPGWGSAFVLGHDQTARMMGAYRATRAQNTRLSDRIDNAGAA